MQKDKIIVGFVGFLAGILLVSLFSSGWGGGMRFGNGMMGNRGQIGSSDNIDQHFIEQMIPHHEDAITMADMALEKSEHEEIKQLARNIKTSQSQEIEWMEKWYKDWFGREVSLISVASAHEVNGMRMGMMGDTTDMERLATAKPFDKVFIEEMIPHHQMAVMMAQMLERTTEREDMKDLAHDIIDAQTREIENMRGWYKAWYQGSL